MKTINYLSALDQSMQPALLWAASGNEPRPLAVCLHTWSFGLEQPCDHYLEQCKNRNWHFIFPYFRGPNWTPEACGSDLVVSDIESAVSYMKENYAVDENRIFLVGGSGGGHASLLMAGRKPELWSAISSWCPISDIAAWFVQSKAIKGDSTKTYYNDHIAMACGGDPTTCPQAMEQARYRSPLTWLKNGKGKVIVDIGTGIHDGHTGSVPISQAMLAYNELAAPEDRVSMEDIDYMVKYEKVPEHLQFRDVDPAYGANVVLMRKTSGMVRLTIFEGGHNMLPGPAFGFLENQMSAQAPVWYSGEGQSAAATELTK